jgi:hypothetical protein
MLEIVQEQDIREQDMGENGQGALRNSKGSLNPNSNHSSPNKEKSVDRQVHWFYDGNSDWASWKTPRDSPLRHSSIMEDAPMHLIDQAYREEGKTDESDKSQEIWQEYWDRDCVVERPKGQGRAPRECSWEKLTEDTPLTITGLQLRMLEFKGRVAELENANMDDDQAEAYMRELETEAMLFQIRVKDLKEHGMSVRLLGANLAASLDMNFVSLLSFILTTLSGSEDSQSYSGRNERARGRDGPEMEDTFSGQGKSSKTKFHCFLLSHVERRPLLH